jgi:hypothetical protein
MFTQDLAIREFHSPEERFERETLNAWMQEIRAHFNDQLQAYDAVAAFRCFYFGEHYGYLAGDREAQKAVPAFGELWNRYSRPVHAR